MLEKKIDLFTVMLFIVDNITWAIMMALNIYVPLVWVVSVLFPSVIAFVFFSWLWSEKREKKKHLLKDAHSQL